MTESEARAALQAQGIKNPSRALVENWLRSQEYAPEASPEEEPEPVVAATAEQPSSQQPQPRASAPEPTTSASQPHYQRSEARHPRGYSKSRLQPVLRETGTLERPRGPRKPGRPPVVGTFFKAVASQMADGLSLRRALALLGIHGLDARQLRSLYRNRVLRKMREEARRKWLAQSGLSYRVGLHRKRARPKVQRGRDVPGVSSDALMKFQRAGRRVFHALCGIHGLTERQIRALYRNRALRTMYQEARRKWLAEWRISESVTERSSTGVPLRA